MKRLKNIEDTSEEQLKMIENKKDNQLDVKSVNCLKKQKMCSLNLIIKKRLLATKSLTLKEIKIFGFEFSDYRSLKQLFKVIYYRNTSIDEVERIQDEHEAQPNVLENYRPRNPDYVEKRKKLLNNAKKIYDGREMIINAFKDKICPLNPEEIFLNMKIEMKVKMKMKMKINFTLQKN